LYLSFIFIVEFKDEEDVYGEVKEDESDEDEEGVESQVDATLRTSGVKILKF